MRDVRKWIENGENVNQIDQYGNTALHIAAEKGTLESFNLLLSISTIFRRILLYVFEEFVFKDEKEIAKIAKIGFFGFRRRL